MTRTRRAAGWAAVVAVLLALPSIAVAERLGSAGPSTSAVSSPAVNVPATSTSGATAAVAAATSVAPSAPAPAELVSVAPSTSPAEAPPTADSILPGSVNATSINLTAEYDATVRLNFGTRSFRVDSTMTVTNSSGGSIDRLELNTIAARLGGMAITLATVDGNAVHPTVSDQTIHVPLGGILTAGQTTKVRIAY